MSRNSSQPFSVSLRTRHTLALAWHWSHCLVCPSIARRVFKRAIVVISIGDLRVSKPLPVMLAPARPRNDTFQNCTSAKRRALKLHACQPTHFSLPENANTRGLAIASNFHPALVGCLLRTYPPRPQVVSVSIGDLRVSKPLPSCSPLHDRQTTRLKLPEMAHN